MTIFQVQGFRASSSSSFLYLKKSLLLCCGLLLGIGALTAQTTWDGSASSDWNNAANWSAGIPGVDDDVTIPNEANDPVLSITATVKSVTVQSGAVLTISAAGSLICNSSSTKHFTNHGTIHNSGSLVLGNLQASVSYGMENTGTLNNNAGATFSLSSVAQYTRGLWNTSTGSVVNNGKMIFGQHGDAGTDAIWNDGAFNNTGCGALVWILSNSAILGTGGGATFTNSGIVIENCTHNSSISSNSGIVQNLNFGSFNVGNNTGLITNDPGIIWTGCTSANWTTASNWATGNLPTSSDWVLIPDRNIDPVITVGTGTSCGFMQILSGAQLTIATNASLFIDGTGNVGLENHGTITSDGTLSIGSVSGGGGNGLQNQGTFNNNSGANLNINRTTNLGLYNYNATFNNSGQITVGALGSAGMHGLVNQGIFNNNSGGFIKVDQCTNQGLLNHNSSTFHNYGQIIIGAVATVGNNGLTNWGTFNNYATGELFIDRFSSSGFNNSTALTDGVVNNQGKIAVGAVAATGTKGVYNVQETTFNNNACGQLILHYPIDNAGTFTNAGLMRSIVSGAHLNTALTNNGVIEYQLGGLIPNVTNNDVIVKDLTGGCGATSPALTIGGANSFTAGSTWYKDAAQTQVAGTYNPATNTFTPTNLPGAGTYTLYFNISDNSNGCPRSVSLDYTYGSDAIPPTVVCKNATVLLNASGTASITTATVFQSGSDNCGTVNQQHVFANSFTCANIGNNVVVLTVNDGNGNTATCNATVTVADNTSPTVVCKNASVNLSAGGTASITTANVFQSGSDNCGTVNQVSVSPNAFTCSNIGNNTVTLSVNDGRGNTATCTANVTVSENTLPTVVCKNASVNLSAGGTASITTANVFQSGSDNCGTVNQVSVSPNAFTCSNIGNNTVTLTVNDGHGNTATCTATVTVADNTAPTVVCKNATVNLSAAGTGSITTASVFQSGSDNCGIVNQVSVSPNAFDCDDLGANTVTLSVNDGKGNTATCTATVTVADNTSPTVVCKNAAVNLSAGGTASIATANVFQSGSDNCGTVNQVSVSPNAFTCSNIGNNTVTLTVNDGHGNTGTCNASVSVTDNINPTVVCKNASVNLSAAGTASITTSSVFQSGSDNCGTVNQVSVTPSTFNCSNIGNNTVTLSVNDGHGNTATCNATVTVADPSQACNATPTAICQNLSINAGAACTVTVAASAVNNGSSDPENSPLMFSLSPAGPFPIGATPVVLTVTDDGGLTATCSATITVTENIAPTVSCKNAAVNLGAAGTGSITTASVFQSGSDNCGIVNQVSVSPNSFTCANLGANTVLLTVNDGHGNTATCNATVTVTDNINPTVVCRDASVHLNAAGSASVTAAAVFQSGSDNCGTVNQQSVLPGSLTCANLGANTVTLTVNDGHGNTGTCTATVSVSDNIAPTIICPPATTVAVGAGCTASLANYTAAATASDNCGTPAKSQSPADGTILNIGEHTVTLTATDGVGQTKTCAFQVTAADQTVPVALCENASVEIQANDQASITVSQINNNSSDNCGIQSLGLSQSLFTCADIGTRTVTLTVTDVNGLVNTCTATVTISDPNSYCCALPTAVCKSTTVALNAVGQATIAVTDVNNGSTYDCGLQGMTVSPASVNCANVGSISVTLTVTDMNGASNQCTAAVTVQDNIAPTATCKPYTAALNNAGQASVSAINVFQSGSDNCGTVNPQSVSPSTFTCAQLGANTVTLTVNDGRGNTATCTTVVTVADQMPPTIGCPTNMVKNADAGQCSAAVTYAPTFSDNCSATVTVTAGLPSGSIFSKGTTTVELKATDPAGLATFCQFTVTVVDNQAPGISCPSNQTVGTTPTLCTGIATFTTPSGSDNCALPANAVTQTGGPASGSAFPKGLTTVTFRVVDGAGLTKTCTFRVTVNDTEAPAVTCPTVAPTVTTANSCSSAPVTYSTPTATDNCPGAITVVRIAGPVSGSSFPAGTTNVTWRAIDAAGRSSTCSFAVTVTDAAPPVITCPQDVSVTGSGSSCTATTGYATPTVTDNCSVQSVFLLSGQPSGSSFPAGTTNIVWRAVDNAGLSATCAFTVTVGCGAAGEQGGVSREPLALGVASETSGAELQTLNFNLWPNPAVSEVQISVESFGSETLTSGSMTGGEITILDAQCRLMWQQTGIAASPSRLFTLSLVDFPAGVYFVTLRSEGQTLTKRLVVQRL